MTDDPNRWVVPSPAHREALHTLSNAVGSYKRACLKVKAEAERNIERLDAAQNPYGFSTQTLIEAATTEATYQATLRTCVTMGMGDLVEAVILDPGIAYSAKVAEGLR